MSLRPYIKHLPAISSPSHSFLHFSRFLSSSTSPCQDPYALLKEDPIQICSSLWVKSFSSPPHFTFSNLTGFLSKLDLWVLAYQRSSAHVTGTFPPRNALHSDSLHSLLSLRNAVLHSRFRWNDKAHQIIRSPNDKSPTKTLSKRKLKLTLGSDGKLCFQDRVVQEVLLMVLEPLFEARFSQKSHGFRPGRNAHTVIRTIRSNFAGYLWFLRGDLSEVFYNINDDVVMSCVENVVKDKKVLSLIKNGLKAPVRSPRLGMTSGGEELRKKKKRRATKKKILNEDEPKPDPYRLRTFFDFAPEEAAMIPNYGCCGILSPLLSNVCLNELDQMMEGKIVEFFRPSKLDSI